MIPKISIIIPNWNGEKFLADCLNSLKAIDYYNSEIILADNGSGDRSVKLVKEKYPEISVIENSENLGFAGGCNIGIRQALSTGADFVLLLNNDTIVAPDFLKRMIPAFDDPFVGIVGCKILYADRPDIIWFAGGDFIRWRVSGKHRQWMLQDAGSPGFVDSDFVTGCVMMIKKEVFADVGFFYEPYFLTVEDLDFCFFAREKGWKFRVALDGVVYHKVSFSREGEFSFSNGYYGTRNRLYFAFRRSRLYWSGIIYFFLVAPARFVQYVLLGKIQMAKGLAMGMRDFMINKMGKYG